MCPQNLWFSVKVNIKPNSERFIDPYYNKGSLVPNKEAQAFQKQKTQEATEQWGAAGNL